MRRTLEGTKRKRQNVSGFRARMATPGGRTVLKDGKIAKKGGKNKKSFLFLLVLTQMMNLMS